MASARAATAIDVVAVRDLLHNGRKEYQKLQNVVSIMKNDPAFDKSQKDFMDRTHRYERGVSMVNRVYELQEKHNWSHEETLIAFNSFGEANPINLHNTAFQPVILSQGSPELIAKYGDLIATRGILGCYLQTELGHGTNVSSLETTATYLPETREFEINSPSLTSSKWWVGALGKTATHGVVQAKLILPGGKDVGPHLFFIQLRSLEDHKSLPGRIIGDIGPKVHGGFTTVDNGFARFDHVRIPKENMLSKFAQVTDDGKYVQPPHAKLSYGGMLYIRANMITSLGWVMAKAATISIRYSTVRRQGSKSRDGLEQQVITYPSQYIRLLPILSHAYVFIQLGRSLLSAFNTMSSRLASGDTSLLAEMHATTSGLKVLATTIAVEDAEVARRAMGGHGFSAFSGLGRLYADFLPSATYEGDNFVLDQQVVRAALKSYTNLTTSANPSAVSLSPSTAYLRLLLSKQPAASSPSLESWNDAQTSIALLEWRAALVVREHAKTKNQADASVNQRVAKAVTEAFVAAQVGKIIDGLSTVGPAGVALKGETLAVTKRLLVLYLLTVVEGALVELYSFGLLRAGPVNAKESTDSARNLRLAIDALCRSLLSNAIGLTDAFGIDDWVLDSALGVYDGNVYNALWERAQAEPLNKTDVTNAYAKSIKHILERGNRQSKAQAKL
ncbi:Peroxisomal acyl-coenzyme A oxidase 1 [Termitomyces sp. J132]|nr:Peroxisomal acyl-coenzyme A oxidase 1 [Termitomyces sp. J132]